MPKTNAAEERGLASLGKDKASLADPTLEDLTIMPVKGSRHHSYGYREWCEPKRIEPGEVLTMVFGVYLPLSSAAATVNGFMVEPGSNISIAPRLRIASLLESPFYHSDYRTANWSSPKFRPFSHPPQSRLQNVHYSPPCGGQFTVHDVLQTRINAEGDIFARFNFFNDLWKPLNGCPFLSRIIFAHHPALPTVCSVAFPDLQFLFLHYWSSQ